MFLAVAIMTISNVPIIFYDKIIGNDAIYGTLSFESIFKGTVINLVFLLFWEFGYLIGLKLKVVSKQRLISERQFKIGIFLLLFTLVFYLEYYTQHYSYAYTDDLYRGEASLEAKSFGIKGALRMLFVPINAALLISYYRRKSAGKLTKFYKEKQWFIYLLWLILIGSIFIGLTQDLQRGDIVKPFLMIAIILLIKGIKTKTIVINLVVLGLGLMIISPFLDILRTRGFYDRNFSVENIIDMTNNTKALEHVHISKSGVLSFENILTQVARKNVLPKTSGALAQYSDREGFVYFSTFPSIILDIFPRFVFPQKPFPLSSDHTKETTAMAISAIESGSEGSVFWESGGGTLYWQFWWIGVIFGGFMVGFVWAISIKYGFQCNSLLILVLLIGNIRWGLPLLLGIDNFFITILRGFKPILVLFVIGAFLDFFLFKQKR